MKKLTKSEAGKLGAKKTHQKRYTMIQALSSVIDKKYQNRILGWPTEHIEILYKELIHEKTSK